MNKLSTISTASTLERGWNLVGKREESFSERSDNWQVSEKGELFESRTAELKSILGGLESAIEAVDIWNEDE